MKKLVIVIEGDSVDDLFAVGVNDLIDHFWKLDKKDVKTFRFEEYDKEAFKRGEEVEVIAHMDNIG